MQLMEDGVYVDLYLQRGNSIMMVVMATIGKLGRRLTKLRDHIINRKHEVKIT